MICKMRYTEFSRQVKVVNIIHYILTLHTNSQKDKRQSERQIASCLFFIICIYINMSNKLISL